MIVFGVLTGVLVGVFGIFVAGASIAGLLGILGAVRFVRCDSCGRLGVSLPSVPLRSCVHCRHDLLLHPLHHHAHTAALPRERPV